MAHRVLIIDDDVNFQEIFSTALKEVGFEVTIATGGRDGFHKASELKPDLILLDVNMPDVNGLDTLAKLNDTPSLKGTKVIFLSSIAGDGPAGDRATAPVVLGDGSKIPGYIHKTEDLDEIVKKIKTLTGHS